MTSRLQGTCVRIAGALTAIACGSGPRDGEPSERTATTTEPATATPAFPLRPSTNSRYLIDQNGAPFLIFGDAGWEAPHNLSSPDQTKNITHPPARGGRAPSPPPTQHT